MTSILSDSSGVFGLIAISWYEEIVEMVKLERPFLSRVLKVPEGRCWGIRAHDTIIVNNQE